MDEEKQEQEHFDNIIKTFSLYRKRSLEDVERRKKSFDFLQADMKARLQFKVEQWDQIKKCIEKNDQLIRRIIEPHQLFLNKSIGVPCGNGCEHERGHQQVVTEFDMDRVRSTLRQFVRDWSEEGEAERSICYEPMISEVLTYFKDVKEQDRYKLRILVPGSGLGRLVHEMITLGFSCQGCEISYFMLLASNFILNRTLETEEYEIHPWIHQFSDNFSFEDQIRPIRVPDVLSRPRHQLVDFSMLAGDFLQVYGDQKDEWDCLLTCFFLDTAKNVADYLDVIYKILKPGGLWVNLGPLLYHYENMPGHHSIELNYEEIRTLIKEIGFQIQTERLIETPYAGNVRSMFQVIYRCVYCVFTKPALNENIKNDHILS